ncbi:hypothetical protein ACSMXN_13190 [Jatrophihabitans sp. DSM 45814]
MNSDPMSNGEPGSRDFQPGRIPPNRLPPMGAGPGNGIRAGRPEIVYLDPHYERPVSQYSPEGEIRMMGDFAAGLTRRHRVSRPMAFALVAIILLPIILSVFAVIGTWL